MNYREEQKLRLMNDLTRRIPIQGGGNSMCEGQGYKAHECNHIWHMNEVIFTRNHIQHLTDKQKEYFWSAMNCSINCDWFHTNHGHTKRFRDWFVNRMIDLFDKPSIGWYILTAQERYGLKCIDYAWVWQDLTLPDAQPVTREDGKIIGNIFNDTLSKRCKSLHMLSRPQGWALDECAIEQAQEAGVKTIIIANEDSGMVYETTLETFLANSLPIDRNYGKQLVLPIKYWKTQRAGSQLALFELMEPYHS